MEKLISTIEAAKILGVSRVTIFNKIKSGEIKGIKIGRNYAISHSEIISQKRLSDIAKDEIDKGIKRVVKEYGETLKLLENN